MYLRLGLTDVVMRHCREDSQLRMLRRMLIVLSLYPTFILRCQKWCDLNPSIPLDLQNQISFLERYELPKLTQLPISALMESALSAMDIFAQLNLHGRISFDYSPDFRMLFVNPTTDTTLVPYAVSTIAPLHISLRLLMFIYLIGSK